ncbi:hypothetical protein ACFWDI_05925 [Streptomyces sp. NPDC060064]|uniref:hypothetical protein n=1 Tax=Streptomyces sp. NPDC060064 TaxID=3347049 RepID=UPI00367A57AD
MTEDEAAERADELVAQAVASMSPKPRLVGHDVSTRPCLDPSDGGSLDRVTVWRSYWLDGVPGGAGVSLVEQARDAWKEKGYVLDRDVDKKAKSPSLHMKTSSDNFWLNAVAGDLGKGNGDTRASITVTSPCVQPAKSKKTKDGSELFGSAEIEGRLLEYSSRVYDALDLRGRVSGGEILADPAGFSVHSWSMEGVTACSQSAGYDRVNDFLRRQCWAVGESGGSGGRIIAHNPADGYTLRVEFDRTTERVDVRVSSVVDV